MRSFLRRLWARLGYRNVDADLAEELQSHRDLMQERLEAAGLTTTDARDQATRAVGNVTLAREDAREVWFPRVLQQVAQDVRYALRGLRRQKSFSLTAGFVLALGLGPVAAAFTLFNTLVLRPWPVPDPASVFKVASVPRPVPDAIGSSGFSYQNYQFISEHAKAAEYGVHYIIPLRVRIGATTSIFTYAGGVSANFFDMLRLPMQLGPGFSNPAPASDPAVVITDGFWRSAFGADPAVVGRRITLVSSNDVTVTVLGVLRPGFDGLAPTGFSLFIPMPAAALVRGDDWLDDPAAGRLNLSGRLKPGMTPSQVLAELKVLTRQFQAEHGLPEAGVTIGGTAPLGGVEGLLSADAGGPVRVLFALVFTGCGLVLLLACANVGNLQLARGLQRQREFAIRMSLGASRARVIRHLLTEALTLAALSAVVAFAIAWVVPDVVMRLDGGPSALHFVPDVTVALFAAATCAVVCLFSAMAPALRTTRSGLNLRTVAATVSGGPGRLRSVMLGVQIAVGLVLVSSATLLARGVGHAWTGGGADFAIDDVVVATASVPKEYGDERLLTLRGAFRANVRTPDGAFALADIAPLNSQAFATAASTPELGGQSSRVFAMPIDAAALQMLGVPLVAGRPHSDDPARHEAVINEMCAKRLWPDSAAVGRTLTLAFDASLYTVVGIAKDAHLTSLGEVVPIVMRPPSVRQPPLVLMRKGSAAEARLTEIVRRIDPKIDLTFEPLGANVKNSLDHAILGASIASGLGLLALILAGVGVFGVFSFVVEERRREIGIRLALGATRRQVGATILGASRAPVLGGLGAGLPLSVVAGVILQSYLFGLSPVDPISYAIVALILSAAACVATFVPVRRAANVDPAVTLRAD